MKALPQRFKDVMKARGTSLQGRLEPLVRSLDERAFARLKANKTIYRLTEVGEERVEGRVRQGRGAAPWVGFHAGIFQSRRAARARVGAAAALHTMFDFFKDRRRAALRAATVDPGGASHRREERALSRGSKKRIAKELEGLVRIFLAEKSFEGCGGLELTEEMKVTIAAQACMLLLHREKDIYPGRGSDSGLSRGIPGALAGARRGRRRHGGRAGASRRVVDSRRRGARLGSRKVRRTHSPHDGQNSRVLHEFAHQLDGERRLDERSADLGRPCEIHFMGRGAWERVRRAVERISRGMASVISTPYGATNPAEFFAVVTEMFFEKPRALKQTPPRALRSSRSSTSRTRRRADRETRAWILRAFDSRWQSSRPPPSLAAPRRPHPLRTSHPPPPRRSPWRRLRPRRRRPRRRRTRRPLRNPARLASKSVPLPGAEVPAFLDYVAYERERARVWVPVSGTGSVDVFDTTSSTFTRVDGFRTAERDMRGKKRTMGPSAAAIGEGVVYVGDRASSEVPGGRGDTQGERVHQVVVTDGRRRVCRLREGSLGHDPRRSTLTIPRRLEAASAQGEDDRQDGRRPGGLRGRRHARPLLHEPRGQRREPGHRRQDSQGQVDVERGLRRRRPSGRRLRRRARLRGRGVHRPPSESSTLPTTARRLASSKPARAWTTSTSSTRPSTRPLRRPRASRSPRSTTAADSRWWPRATLPKEPETPSRTDAATSTCPTRRVPAFSFCV